LINIGQQNKVLILVSQAIVLVKKRLDALLVPFEVNAHMTTYFLLLDVPHAQEL
jgi:hypothetical protein